MTAKQAYVVITPARNEGEHIGHTITSLASQTGRPAEWMIVDDGSTDDTAAIIDQAARDHAWIRVIHRADRGFRKAGGGVMESFYEGYDALLARDWGYLVKLDGDVSFSPDYFERCFARFDADPALGIGGGTICHNVGGALVVEGADEPLFHVRGATKIYRRACWDAIAPLARSPGWDTLDEVKANMKGWATRRFADIRILHHKFTGSADGSWGNAFKNGRGSYISGYHPLFMLGKCVKRLFRRPYLVGSLGLISGFLSGYLRRIPQIDDRELIRYLRRQQVRRMLFKSSIWK